MVRIDKITIAIENIEKTVNFYTNTFGLKLQEIDCGDFKMYAGKIDTIQVLFCPKSIAGISATENTIQLRFTVDDIKSTMEKGICFGGAKISDIEEVSGVQTSALRDPDGNSIEVIQF